ncbi:hypothetical protein PPSIR1_06576 [Plesiocystis pacifica SIR-1]|uniref:Uncharacterized protein n=1 Tax=Plesiocystis pacifica SIR-1 TaxID=391625 RepID=A6GHG9_9BACT|nr:hypothetical protein PPSIR1_06576 [Plesiocystis pacifica SIR-1]
MNDELLRDTLEVDEVVQPLHDHRPLLVSN